MAAGTPVLRLLGAFLCPGLLYTGLIAFRWAGSGGRGSWSSIHADPTPCTPNSLAGRHL